MAGEPLAHRSTSHIHPVKSTYFTG